MLYGGVRWITSIWVLLAPCAPHIAEELWHQTGHKDSVHGQAWPTWVEQLARDEMVEIAVQVDGRLREVVVVPADASEAEVAEQAFTQPKVQQHLGGREIVKIFYVPWKIFNLLTRS